jgi:PPK2 family polyphosphate:nucleotide phosphotransferase
MDIEKLIYPPDKKKKLKDFDPNYTGKYESKEEGCEKLKKSAKKLAELQDKLYAHDKYSLLLVFQAMDAAGKDGTIKSVMYGVNPQGCQVKSFKSPSSEELDHDYLWRSMKALPERGNIGIFNRSYYEEVLITRVHPEILTYQKLPNLAKDPLKDKKLWQNRYNDINNFEKYLTNNGMVILKFFLNVSKEDQKQRFLDRINDPTKNWKFTMNDIKERQFWDKYMEAYEDILRETSTEWAPWYVIPANKKWFMRTAVSDIIVATLESLDLKYPEVSEAQKKDLQTAKEMLESEK